MKIFADMHLHSHYSRATSPKMNIEELSDYAKLKGLNLLGTGDFSHPKWFKELKGKLGEERDGIYSYSGMDYILQNEISLMYSQGGSGRKVHLIVLSPSFDVASQINEWLMTKGRVDYDGRPIFGMNCMEFTENIMEISSENFIVPAHCMTPWFGLFGSMSGFDSVKECFGDQEKHIHAVETGLSADPSMLCRISSLDKLAFISNSDSHSPQPSRIGRECNVFDFENLSYKNIIRAIKERDQKKFLYTIEVDPAYGKYHFDGHRACGVSFSPEETKKLKGICPVCKKPLTIGVLNRVEELADRPEGFVVKGAMPFKKLLPLAEIIANKYGAGLLTKKVASKENELIEKFGTELNVLINADEKELSKIDAEIGELVMKNRRGEIEIIPGYDGVYGKPLIGESKTEDKKEQPAKKQKSLSDF